MSSRVIDGLPGTHKPERIYSLCVFERGAIVPRVQFLAAHTDEEAISSARTSSSFCTRELWLRHRLVAAFKPQT
jgi:hypothetical protein